MTEKKPRLRKQDDHTQIIGFRLSKSLATAVKVEAAQRKLPLNKLFAEMWETYQGKKRAS